MGRIIDTRNIQSQTSLDSVNEELSTQSGKLDALSNETKKLKQELKLNNFYNAIASDTHLDSDNFSED